MTCGTRAERRNFVIASTDTGARFDDLWNQSRAEEFLTCGTRTGARFIDL